MWNDVQSRWSACPSTAAGARGMGGADGGRRPARGGGCPPGPPGGHPARLALPPPPRPRDGRHGSDAHGPGRAVERDRRAAGRRSEERRVGKSVDLGGRRIIKKKKERHRPRRGEWKREITTTGF